MQSTYFTVLFMLVYVFGDGFHGLRHTTLSSLDRGEQQREGKNTAHTKKIDLIVCGFGKNALVHCLFSAVAAFSIG